MVSTEMLYAFGCYLGQVFVVQAKAHWCIPKEGPFADSWPMIQLPDGRVCNPIGKMLKRLDPSEPGGGLGYFYRLFTKVE